MCAGVYGWFGGGGGENREREVGAGHGLEHRRERREGWNGWSAKMCLGARAWVGGLVVVKGEGGGTVRCEGGSSGHCAGG